MSEKIIALIETNPNITAVEISQNIGKTQRTIERKISELKKVGKLVRIGPDKGGYWKVK